MFRPENNQVMETTVDSEANIQLGRSPGREISFGWSLGTTRGHSRLRIYLIEQRLFWLECITVPGEPFPTSDFENLCNSFQPKSGE